MPEYANFAAEDQAHTATEGEAHTRPNGADDDLREPPDLYDGPDGYTPRAKVRRKARAKAKVESKVESTGEPISLRELMQAEFPPRKFLVPGMVLERSIGATAGRPQAGKTPLLQQWAVSIAEGAPWAPGLPPSTKAGVLWLGLERGKQVLYEQLRAQLGGKEPPDNFYLQWEWPRLGEGGEERLHAFLKTHPEIRLIGVDTWALFRPNSKRRDGVLMYDDDYTDVNRLRPFVADYGVSFELVCHANQGRDHIDILAAFYGNTGFVGAVDVRRLLVRGKTDNGKLHVGGTLVEPTAKRLVFDYPKWAPARIEDIEEPEDDEENTKLAFAALCVFGPAGAKYGEWLAESGMKEATFNRHRQALVDADWVLPPRRRGGKYIAIVSGGAKEQILDA